VREIALHLLDIAENSLAAAADRIEITVQEDLLSDRLKCLVQDNGRGMDAATLARITDPFVTSRTTRKVGLGLPFLKAAAEACQGCLSLVSAPGQGTRLEVEFQRSHIDRMPLGDLAGTWLTLLVTCPKVHWLFGYQARIPGKANEVVFTFDDEAIKQTLGDVPLTEPAILAFLRNLLQEGVSKVQRAIAAAEVITSSSPITHHLEVIR
jgi:hypothetical protein